MATELRGQSPGLQASTAAERSAGILWALPARSLRAAPRVGAAAAASGAHRAVVRVRDAGGRQEAPRHRGARGLRAPPGVQGPGGRTVPGQRRGEEGGVGLLAVQRERVGRGQRVAVERGLRPEPDRDGGIGPVARPVLQGPAQRRLLQEGRPSARARL